MHCIRPNRFCFVFALQCKYVISCDFFYAAAIFNYEQSLVFYQSIAGNVNVPVFIVISIAVALFFIVRFKSVRLYGCHELAVSFMWSNGFRKHVGADGRIKTYLCQQSHLPKSVPSLNFSCEWQYVHLAAPNCHPHVLCAMIRSRHAFSVIKISNFIHGSWTGGTSVTYFISFECCTNIWLSCVGEKADLSNRKSVYHCENVRLFNVAIFI